MKEWKELFGIELNVVSWREKLIACAGGIVSIVLLIFITERTLGLSHATALVASMGASAVLLFAVPHGQLSQPWPLVAGHVFSALIGVSCAKWIPVAELAAACAVGLSIGAMHQFKCIHPPGGATALTAVLGGPAIQGLGYRFALCPVLLNAVLMVAVGILFNYSFSWRRYPVALVRRGGKVPTSGGPDHEEVVRALRNLDSFVDIAEEDLVHLVRVLRRRKNPAAAGVKVSERREKALR